MNSVLTCAGWPNVSVLHSLGLLSSTRSQAQRWSESMEMGFCRIQNLVLAFWLVTGSISSFSPEIPDEIPICKTWWSMYFIHDTHSLLALQNAVVATHCIIAINSCNPFVCFLFVTSSCFDCSLKTVLILRFKQWIKKNKKLFFLNSLFKKKYSCYSKITKNEMHHSLWRNRDPLYFKYK